MMTLCPIAYWSRHTPDKIAIQSSAQNITYADLDRLIGHMCGFLAKAPHSALSFPAEISPQAVALLFASFRMQSCIFPHHPQLSEEKINTFPAWKIHPQEIPLDHFLQISTLQTTALATAIATSGTTGKAKIALKPPDGLPLSGGKPLPHAEIKINEEREILVRGSSLFYGYFGEEPIAKNAWFPTRDLGSHCGGR